MALSPFFHDGFRDLLWPTFNNRYEDPFPQDFMIMPVIPRLDRRAFPVDKDMILHTSSPGYEIHRDDTDGKYQISVDVPGIQASDLNVQVENDGTVLHISGGRNVVAEDGKSKTTMKFTKRFTIGSDMDMPKMTANLANGVLTLTAPVKEKQPRPDVYQIAISETKPAIADGKVEEKKEA